jgi:hypothetical protein
MIHDRLTDSRSEAVAWIIWATTLLVISAIVAARPDERTVTRAYRSAAQRWVEGQDIYRLQVHGFHYLPHAAVLHIPFTLGPKPLGEALHRWAIGALFVWALWRLAGSLRVEGGVSRPRRFLLLTLLVLASAVGNLRNGQGNIPLAAALIHALVDLGRRRWTAAALWLMLALAVKPLALAPILLVAVIHFKTMGWRLLVGSAALAAAPFLAQAPDYVARQYELCAAQWTRAASVPVSQFVPADLAGMLHHFRHELGESAFAPIERLIAPERFRFVRAGFAVVTLLVAALAVSRMLPMRASIAVFTFGVGYLMLFNPRTEGYTYVLITPLIAVQAAHAVAAHRPVQPWMLAAACVLLGSANDLLRPLVDHWAANWVNPAVTLVFLAWFTASEFRARSSPLQPDPPVIRA